MTCTRCWGSLLRETIDCQPLLDQTHVSEPVIHSAWHWLSVSHGSVRQLVSKRVGAIGWWVGHRASQMSVRRSHQLHSGIWVVMQLGVAHKKTEKVIVEVKP